MLRFVPDDASLASTFVWSATDLNLAGLGIATNKQARRRVAVHVAYTPSPGWGAATRFTAGPAFLPCRLWSFRPLPTASQFCRMVLFLPSA